MNVAKAENFSVEKAHQAQLQMSRKIVFQDRLPKRIQSVAGVDVAYTDGVSTGAVALLDFESLQVIESQTAFCDTQFPYFPSLLSFREMRPAVLCIRELQTQPDIILVDGQGSAHPYRCGLASHLGLVLGKPTIGVAKTRLIGECRTHISSLVRFLECGTEVVGAAVTTKNGCRPVYVSVGHLISLRTAVKVVTACARNSRMPEPLLIAHRLATNEKRKSHIFPLAETS